MKIRGYLLLFCILLYSGSASPQQSHLPGFPGIELQAETQSTFTPVVPGYWNHDSSYYYQWLEPSSEWYLWEKYYVTVNSAGYQTQGLYLVYDSVAGIWINSTRYITIYDASNQVITLQGQVWNTATNSWVDVYYSHKNAQSLTDESFTLSYNRITNQITGGSRSLFQYDAAGNTTEWIYQSWVAGTEEYVNRLKYNSTYSATDNIIMELRYDWNEGTSAWDNSNKLDYTYDASDFLTGMVQYNWDPSESDWQNSMRLTYINDSYGDPVSELTELWTVSTASWRLNQFVEMQYDPNHKRTQHFTQYWSSQLNSWVNWEWSEYGYWPNQNMQSSSTRHWNSTNSTWIQIKGGIYDTSGNTLEYYSKTLDYVTYNFTGGYKNIYEYNENQQPVLTLSQDLNTTLNMWIDSQRRLTSYDPAGNNVLELDQVWDGTWKDQFKMVHFYSEQLGVAGPDPVSDFCLFANPLKKGGQILCPGLDPYGTYSMAVYALNGQQVFRQEFSTSQPILISATVSSGVYILQIRLQDRIIATGKVVITD